jgi:hypothetical protein
MSDQNGAESDFKIGQAWRPQGYDQISSMDPATRAAYERAATINVFGNAAGTETGIGSEHNQGVHHRAALQKEAERKVMLKAAIAAEAKFAISPDPAALQTQIDELKAQLAAIGAAPATAPQP